MTEAAGDPRYFAKGRSNEWEVPGNVPRYDTYRPPRNLEEWKKLAHASMTAIGDVGHGIHDLLTASGSAFDPHQSLPLPALGAAKVEYHEGETGAYTTLRGDSFDVEEHVDAIPYRRIVKIEPVPRAPIPPATGASWAAMQEGAARYNREVAEKTAITWSSLDDVILISRLTPEAVERKLQRERDQEVPAAYLELLKEAGADPARIVINREFAQPTVAPEDVTVESDTYEVTLDELDAEEAIRFAEILQGVATAVATEARRVDVLVHHSIRNIWGPDQDV